MPRRLVDLGPLIGIELPPDDEKPRTRVADAEEAAALTDALSRADAVPYALAFYAGLRRAEIKRLGWPDVQLDGDRLVVRKSKSRAGTGRRQPIAEPLLPILLGEFMRQGAAGRRACQRRLRHVWQARRACPRALGGPDAGQRRREPTTGRDRRDAAGAANETAGGALAAFLDSDGFDREALATIEGPGHGDQ